MRDGLHPTLISFPDPACQILDQDLLVVALRVPVDHPIENPLLNQLHGIGLRS
ncbi:MAG: hypothetical protein BWY82_01698 [Verrucomicrobia bacterium ADurb.Bin474]|nr:MAG: hypothetical protein BWY82_01698 [Verrucomicrobia bacterium ADurb.Bin474]